MKQSLSLIGLLVGLAALAAFQPSSKTATGRNLQIAQSSSSCVIVLGQQTALTRRVAEKFQSFVFDLTGARVPIIQPEQWEKKPARSSVFIGWPTGLDVEKKMGSAPDQTWGEEAFLLKTISDEHGISIIAAGKTDKGTKYAVYELMRKAHVQNGGVTVPALDIRRDPLIKTRRAILGIPGAEGESTRNQMRYCFENWDISEIERYVDVLDFFGYNSIEISITPARFTWTGNHISLPELIEKYDAICRRAHLNRQTVSLFFWGHIFPKVSDGTNPAIPKGKVYSETLSPAKAADREEIHREYRRWLKEFGEIVDHVHMHWVDPGGDRDSTIAAPQELTRDMVSIAREINPALTISFSLWYMQPTAWAGYQGPDTVLDSGILPKGVQIALPGARVDADLVDKIVAKGYEPALWAWYYFDMETVAGFHYHGRIMDHDFHLMSPDAARKLAWHTADVVHHRINLPTIYVGAQKLWNPVTPSGDLLREFTAAVYGDSGSSVALALEALGDVRCGVRVWGEDKTPFFSDVNAQNASCNMGAGSDDPKADLLKLERALQALDQARFPLHKSRFPLVIEPAELVTELRQHLRLAAAYAQLRLAVNEIKKARERGAGRPEVSNLIDRALVIELPDVKDSFGALEKTRQYPKIRQWLEQQKEELRSE